MSSFFSSFNGIVFMSVFTIVFILGFLGYLAWKFYKLSGHKPEPGEKSW
jgi:predicted negative regulator of RcsB-dependent stress response